MSRYQSRQTGCRGAKRWLAAWLAGQALGLVASASADLPYYSFLRPGGEARYGAFFLSLDGAEPRPVGHDFACEDYALAPNGSYLAYVSDMRVRLLDLESGETRQVEGIVMRWRRIPGRQQILWTVDGARFAVSGYDEQTRMGRVFIVEAASGKTTPVQAEANDPDFFWSPDGQRLYFTNVPCDIYGQTSGGSIVLRQVKFDGTGERRISGDTSLRFLVRQEAGGRVAFAAFARPDPQETNSWLYVYDSAPGTLTRVPDIINPRQAAWSPDGTRIAVAAGGGVYLCQIADQKPRRISPIEGQTFLDWSKTGRWLAARILSAPVASSKAGASAQARLLLLDTQHNDALPLQLFEGYDCRPPVFSNDGVSIAFPYRSDPTNPESLRIADLLASKTVVDVPVGEVRSLDFHPASSHLLIVARQAPPGRFAASIWPGQGQTLRPIGSGLPAEYAGWSADGSHVLLSMLVREQQGVQKFALYAAPSDGGPARRISGELQVLSRAGSADPNRIPVVAMTQAAYNELLVGRPGQPASPVSGKLHAESPVWSPDGSKLAFNYEVFASRYASYIVDIAANQVPMVTGKVLGGAEPVWLPDSTGIIIALGQRSRCALYRCTAGAEPALLTPPDTIVSLPLTFSPSGRQFCVAVWQPSKSEPRLHIFPVNGGSATPLDCPPGYCLWSSDGQRIAVLDSQLKAPWGSLWLVRADGGQAVTVTSRARDAIFGPDETLLVIENHIEPPAKPDDMTEGADRALLIPPGAAAPKLLADHVSYAQWSPDGKLIALGPAPTAPKLSLRIVSPAGELKAEVAWPETLKKSPAHPDNALTLPLGELGEIRMPRDPVEWVQWSPSGNYVAFCGIGEDMVRHVYVADLKGQMARMSGGYDIAQMEWLPGEDRLALRSVPGKGPAHDRGSLFILAPAGGRLAPLTEGLAVKRFTVLPEGVIAVEAEETAVTSTWLLRPGAKPEKLEDYPVEWSATAPGPPRHLRPPDPRHAMGALDLTRLFR